MSYGTFRGAREALSSRNRQKQTEVPARKLPADNCAMAPAQLTPQQVESALRDYALTFPEATEDFPWGERAIKVKGKVFLFMRADAEEVSFSVKLPHSRFFVLDLPNTEPTHYGLGKHGWVNARYPGAPKKSLEMFKMWIDESYRAVAPRKLLAKLDGGR
jgi:predicted DNA-binding protein (MmcQ/YjbR family)